MASVAFRYLARTIQIREGAGSLRLERLCGVLLLAFISLSTASLFAQSLQTGGDRMEPLSVCEVLERRTELMGRYETLQGEYKNAAVQRIISVRGEVKPGGHGPYLIAEPSCAFELRTSPTTWPNGLITRGAAWPNIIWLEYPSNKPGHDYSHAPFEVDWNSVRQTDRQVLRQRYNSASDRLLMTYTGLLVSFDTLELRASSTGLIAKRLGFGPVGLDAPAKLLIRSVADGVVIREEMRTSPRRRER